MSLFVILLLVATAGIAIVLTARLLRSYPVVFGGFVIMAGGAVFAFMQDQTVLGIFWLVFSVAACVASALYWYKNLRGAFWWGLGATIALIVAAVPWEELVEDADTAQLLGYLVAPIVFVVIGLLGCLLVPRLIHKDKDQRKHHTNVDLIIGKRITITKDKEGLASQRGFLNDVDWAIEPLYPYLDTFKVGDVVKVCKIKGVTLLCVRDGKDYRDEQKAKRKAEAEEARRKREEEAAKKAAEEAPKEEEVKEEPKVEEPAPVEEVAPAPEPAPEPQPEPEPEPQPEPQPEPEPVVEEPAPEPQPEPAPAKEKAEFVPFQARLAQADDFLRNAYNELKSEVLSYGIKSRVSSTGDTFRLHKKAYVKMVVAGKYLKLFLALNPEDYKDTTYPFEDASKLGTKKDTPFVFKIKSGLSIRRAKVLIGDAAKKDNLEQGEVVPHDHFADLKVMEGGAEEEEAE